MFKNFKAVCLILTLSVFLAACGDGNTDNEASGNSEVRTVEVTVPPTSKNLSWQTSDGEILGYEPDVMRAVDEKLENYEFNIQAVADEAQETGLKTGQYDIAVGGFYKNSGREEQYLIPPEPTGFSLIRLYVSEDSQINDMNDLEGTEIVPLTAGGGVHNFIMNWMEENPNTNLDIETSSGGISYSERLQSVDSGQYDVLALPSNLGQSEVIEELDLDIRVTEPVQIDATYALIHNSEENRQLMEDINNALEELKEDGTLSEISEEYYGEDVFQYEE